MDKTYLTIDEVDQLEAATTNLRDRLLIRLLFRLACRVSELLPLTAHHFDFKSNLVELELHKERLRLGCPLCGARLTRSSRFCSACGNRVEEAVRQATEERRLRRLPLDAESMALVKEFIDRGGPAADGRLFPIGYRMAHYVVKEAARRARLPALVHPETGKPMGISPHRLRDAFATMAVQHDDSSDSLRVLQERLGHKDIKTTWKYRKLTGREQRQWFDRLWEGRN